MATTGIGGWRVFGQLTNLRDEIDKLFETPFTELNRASQLLSGWTPALDVFEAKEHLTVRAETAGIKGEH